MPTIQVAAEARPRAFALSTSFFGAKERPLLASQEVRCPTPQAYRLSQHAMLRMAQRGIPSRVVETLVMTGKREHDGRGGLRIHLRHKAAQRRFASALGERIASGYLDVYAVLASDSQQANPTLVTVGWLSGKQLRR